MYGHIMVPLRLGKTIKAQTAQILHSVLIVTPFEDT